MLPHIMLIHTWYLHKNCSTHMIIIGTVYTLKASQNMYAKMS